MWSVPDLVLFNIFINDLDDDGECALTRFADDTKLARVAGTPVGPADTQSNLDRLDKWADRNLRKFNKEKYKVLHLGRNNLMHQKMLGGSWLESRKLAEKALELLVDTKLNMSQQ
ncbi:mitochondrial enolase superfamily member 1 [Grus japonensis]|uniref:Mitochondrial enolase superfamily member 1 n=1 Tax=Grus japonensis TaxID=30415 RepID=A0ABC9W8W3_GRUJA